MTARTLGAMLMDEGNEAQAEAEELFHRSAIAGHRGAWMNLGILLAGQGRVEELQPRLPHPRKFGDAPLPANHGRSRRSPTKDERHAPQVVTPAQPLSRP